MAARRGQLDVYSPNSYLKGSPMRLEVVYHNNDDRERVYLLEDAADFVLDANSLGDVSLRARCNDVALVLDR